MSEDKLTPLHDQLVDHAKFFMLFGMSYFVAENIVLLLNRLIPTFFAFSAPLFGELSYSLFLNIFMLFTARITTTFLPEINFKGTVSYLWSIIAVIIVSHPLLIQVSGSTFSVNWLLLNIIEAGTFGTWVLELIIFVFSAILLILIPTRGKHLAGRYQRVFQYLSLDIVNLLYIFLISFYLIRSFIAESFESITLTIPIKFVLILLLLYGTQPLESTSES